MKKRKRRTRRTPEVPIASMGDIAFLLIIFFLVCSEISKDRRDLPVVLPLSEYVEKSENPPVARVAVDENGVIYLEGEEVETAKDVEWGVRSLLANTAADEQRHVKFTCDKELPRQAFEPVLQAIAEAGGIVDAVGERNE